MYWMKYAIFILATLCVPPLGFILYVDAQLRKYAFWAIIASMMMFNSTSINFFSNEFYTGSARGMEVNAAHLVAASLLISLKLHGKSLRFIPETGFAIYLIYFSLCLLSLSEAANYLVSWYEIWKMMLLYVFCLTILFYLRSTDDMKSVLNGLALYAIVNLLVVLKQRASGAFQAHGVFPHQNSMGMAMQLLGPLFLAGYLRRGTKSREGKLYMFAAAAAAVSTLRSYSRGAIATMPLAYGIPSLICLFSGRPGKTLARLAPIIVAGAIGLALLLPKIIERFMEAPEASANTRVELAYCASEMIHAHPVFGVGINNWSIKMQPPYKYQDRAALKVDRDIDYVGIVETVYLLVCAECGIPALVAMLAWFLWYWASCIRLIPKTRGTQWDFIPMGLLGGLTAIYLQSALEWVLRQQVNLLLLMFVFAIIAYLNMTARPALAIATTGGSAPSKKATAKA